MSSPTEIKTCGVCLGSLSGQAVFIAECSHSFHLGCVSNNHFCPLCQATWNNVPLNNMPIHSTNNISPTDIYHPPFYPEPLQFSDDEPLPATPSDPLSALPRVTIKGVPERPAVAASESVSQFMVLAGLKAPSLSDDARGYRRAPIDLVTVLDVSGSMHGAKLNLLKRAVCFVIDNLGPHDRLSIVCFDTRAQRMLPLRRMTEDGRADAKRAVNSLVAGGGTNIVEGLKKGVCVLGERLHRNPVASIIFLSDGNDTCNFCSSPPQPFPHSRRGPQYLHLLPASIFPGNGGGPEEAEFSKDTIPVHSFGFGSDHDPVTMHAISDASGGTFSFIEAYQMVQDAFASCIGGLLSVVTQELRLTLRSASHGVEIKSISSGRYASGITNQGSHGLINIGDLYADEEKEFLVNVSVPALSLPHESEGKTSLVDIMCSYRDVVSDEIVKVDGDLVEIRRPKTLSPGDMVVNLEVDRQRNRLYVAESIAQAQQMAEAGDLRGASALLAERRSELMRSALAQAGDGLCMWLENDMKELEKRFGSLGLYRKAGRAFALSGMSSHAMQRATVRGNEMACDGLDDVDSDDDEMCGDADFEVDMAGEDSDDDEMSLALFDDSSYGGHRGARGGGRGGRGGRGAASGRVHGAAAFAGAFVTPNMVNMVNKSREVSKTLDDALKEE